MASTGQVRDREVTATRLLRSAARASFDPGTEVDWDAPFDPTMPYMPPERISLYGTPAWDRLGERERIELSRHELASLTAIGVWLELNLMQLFMRHIYDLDPRTAHARFALTEVGDETRHSVMFGRLLGKLGTPAYGVPRAVHNLGRAFKALGGGPSMWAIFLVGEELFDRFQRETMDDERVQPVVRTISRIHVVEEARHVRYAREEIVRSMDGVGRARQALHRAVAAFGATAAMEYMVDPEVYRSVGIPPHVGRRIALANPHHQDTRLWMGEKIVPFLAELGMVSGPLWRRAGLVR
ncbi:diiron oxygenase [Spirillospora sp. NPDC047279]|uniref:AurF N-oxygenase family protein n=1 Tax=Spirillospora sp. NPDC047279 TaxID=3155478 RepID=UPI0033E4CD76